MKFHKVTFPQELPHSNVELLREINIVHAKDNADHKSVYSSNDSGAASADSDEKHSM